MSVWRSFRAFRALVWKNLLLQTRSRKSFLGVSAGWLSLILQIAIPACFFLVMCLPKYYIKPISHGPQLTNTSPDLDSRWWSGPDPYTGPATSNTSDGRAHMLLAPASPATSSLVTVLARALACPPDPAKRTCPPGIPPNSFYCLFAPPTSAPPLPAQCNDPDTCMQDDACYGHLLSGDTPHLQVVENEGVAMAKAMGRPALYDAILLFPDAGPGRTNGSSGSSEVSRQLLRYTLRMNHTAVPPTRYLLDLFDVLPSRMNGLSLYKRYWFFANLQHAVDRSLLGLRRAELAAQLPQPPQPPPAPPLTPPPTVQPPAPSLPPQQPPAQPLPPQQHAANWQQLLEPHDAEAARTSMLKTFDTSGSLSSGPDLAAALPASVAVSIRPFPWPAVREDLGAGAAAVLFNLLLVYSFLAPSRGVVGAVVREKELRLREGMALMGLGDVAYWTSWGLTHWGLMMGSAVLCVAVATYPFANTSALYMLSFFALFTASLTAFSYWVSTLFSTSRVAGTAAQLLYALASLPGFIAPMTSPYAGTSWFLACLFPPSAASLFAACLVNWELVSVGVNGHTAALPVSQGSSFSVNSVLWLLGLDVLLYSLLAWYCDKVLPTRPGHTLPPLFFLDLKGYWGCGGGRRKQLTATHHNESGTPLLHQGAGSVGPALAAPGAGSTGSTGSLGSTGAMGGVAIRLCGLVREFQTTQGGTRVAVAGVNADIPTGRVTALLGHNGAGKTTLISVLTGTLPPTSGTAYVGGRDITHQMNEIRRDLGICPQFDVLWPDLTVREHLLLCGALRGLPAEGLEQVAEAAATEVGLGAKLHAPAGTLSGGQRRKLSVALAFLGDPSVVILDEPTSGMDPYTRRFTWDIMRARRGRAALLLTTHSMEEADQLADDIMIMAAGSIVARGSPHFLKAAHGEGYTLTLALASELSTDTAAGVEQPGTGAEATVDASPGSITAAGSGQGRAGEAAAGSSVQRVVDLVRAHMPGATVVKVAGRECALRLPRADTPAFPALLRELDAAVAAHASATGSAQSGAGQVATRPDLASLGLTTYGLSVTTLEEVFLAVTERASSGKATSDSAIPASAAAASPALLPAAAELAPSQQAPKTSTQPPQLPPLLQGPQLLWSQARGLFSKRALCARRDALTLLTQFAVPLALIYLALWVSSLSVRGPSEQPLTCDRATCLMWSPSVIAAAESVRASGESGSNSSSPLAAWLDAWPSAQAVDSNVTMLWSGGPVTDSVLDGWLLSRWWEGAAGRGQPAYDAVMLHALPDPPSWLLAGNSSTAAVKYTLLLNQTAVSGLPAVLSQASSVLLRYMETAAQDLASSSSSGSSGSGSSSTGSGSSWDIQVTSNPLPVLPVEPLFRVRQDAASLMLVVCLTLAASVMSAAFAVFLVRERVSCSKHVQLVCGARPWIFWSTHFAWDYCVQYSCTAVCIIGLIAYNNLPQYSGGRLGAVAALLWGFGAAGVGMTYALQGLFTDEMFALQRLNTIYFLTGYLGFVATWIADLIVTFTASPRLKAWDNAAKALFRTLSPHYCFARGVYDVTQTYQSNVPFPIHHETDPWAWSVTGSPLAHMAAQAVGYYVLALALDTGVAAWVRARLAHVVAVVHARMAGAHGAPSRQHASSQSHLGTTVSLVVAPRALNGSAAGAGAGDSANSNGAAGGNGGDGVTIQAQGERSDQEDENEDEDVAAERRAVQSGGSRVANCPVAVCGLKKTYWTPPAGKAGGVLRSWLRALRPHQHATHLASVRRSALSSHPDPSQLTQPLLSSSQPDVESGPPGMDSHDPAMGGQAHSHHDVSSGGGADSSRQWGGPVQAVKGLWLAVPPGECFGLLGVNGAGKTTTFRMLTGEEAPDEGDAAVGGHSVTSDLPAARQLLGYCPQFEALLGQMTGRETLALYARLRGVPEPHIPHIVSHLLAAVGLSTLTPEDDTSPQPPPLPPSAGAQTTTTAAAAGNNATGRAVSHASANSSTSNMVPQHGRNSIPDTAASGLTVVQRKEKERKSSRALQHADNACGRYSGGTKRKLALAAALVGWPRVALLDEPTTGLDPGARRGVWALVGGEVLHAGRAVVLTSHVMEECEALCGRLAIMVAGRAVCIGSPLHLKNRFGGGHVLELRCEECSELGVRALVSWLGQEVPAARVTLVDSAAGRVEAAIPRGTIPLAHVFEVAEVARAAGTVGLASYSVTESTLEHVFVALAGGGSGGVSGGPGADGDYH